jgi:hypothetical protein
MYFEEFDGPVVSALRRAIAEVKQWSVIGRVTKIRWSRMQWARVVSYGPFFLCVIHKKGL